MSSDQPGYGGERPDSAPEGIRIELPDLSRVVLEPGDVLLVRTQKRLSQAEVHALRVRLGACFANPVVVAPRDFEFAVIRPTTRDDGGEDPRPQEV
jgi:hypothetical protein